MTVRPTAPSPVPREPDDVLPPSHRQRADPLPWERLDREGERAFEAFSCYRDMPRGARSLRRVGRTLGKSQALIDRWSSGWQWTSRVAAYDGERDREVRAAHAAAAAELVERQLATARLAHDLVRARLTSLDPRALTPMGAVRLWDVASRLEREALGLRVNASQEAQAADALAEEEPEDEPRPLETLEAFMRTHPDKVGAIVELLGQLQTITQT